MLTLRSLRLPAQYARPGHVAAGTALGVALQAALGAPFLLAYPRSYLTRAFEFSRVGALLSPYLLPACAFDLPGGCTAFFLHVTRSLLCLVLLAEH